ncbi:MAG: hypothetical protein LLF94_10165 [Chlamydiales bacterium]|nr:hypothetical protein [Chlamydiales bacterium]
MTLTLPKRILALLLSSQLVFVGAQGTCQTDSCSQARNSESSTGINTSFIFQTNSPVRQDPTLPVQFTDLFASNNEPGIQLNNDGTFTCLPGAEGTYAVTYHILSFSTGRVYLQNDTTSTPISSSCIVFDSAHTGFLRQTAIVQLAANEILSVRCTCPTIGFDPNVPVAIQIGGRISFEQLSSSVVPSVKAAVVEAPAVQEIDVVDAINDLITNQVMPK